MFAQWDGRLNWGNISFWTGLVDFLKGQSAFGLFKEVPIGLRLEGLQPEIRNAILVGDRITASEHKGERQIHIEVLVFLPLIPEFDYL